MEFFFIIMASPNSILNLSQLNTFIPLLLIDIIGHSSWCEINNQSRLEIILDVSAANVSYSLGLWGDACVVIERISRRLCHSIHSGPCVSFWRESNDEKSSIWLSVPSFCRHFIFLYFKKKATSEPGIND